METKMNFEPKRIIEVLREYCKLNDGDEATQDILVSMTSEMMDVPKETLLHDIRDSDWICCECETNNVSNNI